MDGEYSITVPSDATLVFSFVGMKKQEVPINGRTQIDVQMESASVALQEVVAIGYGTQKVEEVTSSAASVSRDDFVEGNVDDAAQLMKGKVAGLSIVNPSGDPLGGSQISLRGVSTLASGTQPLILIDGVPGTLNSISEEDIASINVLKSGAAAAIYGTRATNGVILIETTDVTQDIEPTITVKTSAVTERIRKTPDVLTASEYSDLVNSGDPFTPTQDDEGASTNWFDQITRNPVSYKVNVNMKGGDAQTNYIINLQRKDQEGVILDSENQETKLRLKAGHSMFDDKLEVNANVIGYIQNYNESYGGTTVVGQTPYTYAILMNPTEPVKDENGNWVEHVGQKDLANPLAMIEETQGTNEVNRLKTYGNVIFRPVEDLSLKLRGSLNNYNRTEGTYQTQNHLLAKRGVHEGRASRYTNHAKDQLLEFITTYDKDFADHSITGVGGYSWEQHTWENYWMQNSNFPSDLYQWNNIGVGTQLEEGKAGMTSYKAQTRLVGFFFRVNYDYKKKYFLMASLRHEGSSKFGSENKWGSFPAVSGGWNIAREPFMDSFDFLTHLKLRGGYGVTGTAPSSPYQSIPQLSLGSTVYLNGQWISPAIPSSNPNPYLKWERKKEYNVGLDLGFFEDRLHFTADYYQRKTEGLIWNYTVPKPPYLYDNILANAGSIENTGLELSVMGSPIESDEFTWQSTLNFSSNKNNVVSLQGDVFQVEGGFFYSGWTGAPIQEPTHRVEEGKSVGNFYGYKTIDISDDGMWIIEGADGEPKPLANKTPDDKQYLGNGLPNYTLGWNNTFHYKNFTLSIGLSGAFDFQLLNMDRMFHGNPVSMLIGNGLHEAVEPIYGKRPLSINQPRSYVSHYIEDGDYVKIDNATLSYRLTPQSGFVKNLKIFLNGLNLYTFTDYSGIDPEVNVLGLSPGVDERTKYPSTRSFSLGAEITF